ncbi:MAG: hypothetical protein IJP16_05010 [Clostridia bacterium]|nr:hypothetical protein [Clostridia bacterium]
MKKTLSFVMFIIFCTILLMLLCSCKLPEEVERTAIDCRYTEAHTEVVTDYKHKYSWYHGDFMLVPDTHTEYRPEKYEILYLVKYDDGSSREEWKQVDRNTYLSFGGDE